MTNLLFLLSTASENPGYLQNSPKFPRDPQRFTETSMKGSFLKILNPIHSFWKRLGLKNNISIPKPIHSFWRKVFFFPTLPPFLFLRLLGTSKPPYRFPSQRSPKIPADACAGNICVAAMLSSSCLGI